MSLHKLLVLNMILISSLSHASWLNCSSETGLVRNGRLDSGMAHPRGWSYNNQDTTLPVVEERFDLRHRLTLLEASGYEIFSIPVELYGINKTLTVKAIVTCGSFKSHSEEGWMAQNSNAQELLPLIHK